MAATSTPPIHIYMAALYTHTHTHISDIYTHIDLCTHIWQPYTHTHTHTNMADMYTHIDLYTYIWQPHTHTQGKKHTHTHIWQQLQCHHQIPYRNSQKSVS